MRLSILIMLLLVIFLLEGCTTQVAEIGHANNLVQRPENEEKRILPEPKQEDILQKNPEKCPDGVWDEAEQRNPDLCPDDNPNLKSTDRTARIGEMKEDYVFIPDAEMRKNDASNPGIFQNQNGIFYLYYRDKVATSTDGLTFSEGVRVSDTNDFRGIKLPDGTWRRYYWDERGRTPSTNYGLKSKSSKDGVHYTEDSGYRYQLHESDIGTAGIHEFFVDNLGGVVLLYIGDLLGLNNIRRAYSKDNGWTFNFEKGNILGDANDGKPGTFIDHKVITLSDGKRRLYAVRQGSIYSFISNDDGKTFIQEQGVRLSPSDFTEFDIIGFSDPVFIKLQDGRWRVYATAFLRGYAPKQGGSQKEIIVSATSSVESSASAPSPTSKGDQSWQDVDPQAKNMIKGCPENISGILTYPLFKNEVIGYMVPLGHINPERKHVKPISHMYYNLKKEAGKVPVFAPADSFISVGEYKFFDESGKVVDRVFNIDLIPCKEVWIHLLAVQDISDNLEKMLNDSKPCEVTKGCQTDGLKKNIKAGDLIGRTAVLEIAAYDSRNISPFISPERYHYTELHGICPIDLFSDDLKRELYDKLAGPEPAWRRTIEPRCGSIAQDIPGTIQGEWFISSSQQRVDYDVGVLSIIHGNFDPLPGVIAIVDTIVPSPSIVGFTPRHEGFINREPSEVKDSKIYCYYHEKEALLPEGFRDDILSGTKLTGRILVQLVDAKTLKVEYQEKSCDESLNFKLPIIYER